jgi:hypothetical protein
MAEAVRERRQALESAWREIADDLQRRRQALAAEIRDYPTPIPRCDAQFNHLYEQQARLVRDWERWSALAKDAAEGSYAKILGEFVRSVPYTDDPEEKILRARLAR